MIAEPQPDDKDAKMSDISFMLEPKDEMDEDSDEEDFEEGIAPFILI